MRSGRGIFGGVVLIALGFLWLLNNLHIIFVRDVVRFWPVLLIIWGVSMFLRPDRFYREDRKEYRHTKHTDERPASPRDSGGWQPPSGGGWQAPNSTGGWQPPQAPQAPQAPQEPERPQE